MYVEGSTYFPNNLYLLGGTGNGLGNQIIAWRISVFSAGTLTLNYTGIHPGPLCEADVDGSFAVNMDDLLTVINSWGPCKNPSCAGDVNMDGGVDVDDLLAVINAWGECS
jgi:hypothetical protein